MHVYLMVSPTEALIASMLESQEFGAYMATGSCKTAAEKLMFFELTGEFGSDFDWDYARRSCVPHADGTPKRSVYLSVYRVLERVPLDALGSLFLVTRDGRCLELHPQPLSPPSSWRGYALYQELCPVTPLVASSLPPEPFSRYLVDPSNHVGVPAIVFADVHITELENMEHAGDAGRLHDQGWGEHMLSGFEEFKSQPGKRSKTIDRSFGARFRYQNIGHGLYVARHKDGVIWYPMPDKETIKKYHYEWGRSANFY